VREMTVADLRSLLGQVARAGDLAAPLVRAQRA